MKQIALYLALVATPTATAPTVQVTGLVAHPGPVVLDRLPQSTMNGTFTTMHGPSTHTWTGPLLLDVINATGLTDEPGARTHMRHVILAIGQDGYAAAIALGELDPHAEGKKVIVAIRQDGTPLPTPRIVVPTMPA